MCQILYTSGVGLPTEALVASVVALCVTMLGLPILRRRLVRLEVLDPVSDRSSHHIATPRGAGLAQMLGIIIGMASVAVLPLAAFFAVVGFSLLGAWDDWNSRSPRLRLFAQALVATATVGALLAFGSPPLQMGVAILAAGVCVFLVIVNSANFMDGANGLSATHGILFGTAYAVLSWQVGLPSWAILGLCLAAASGAFLPWNFRGTASLFLGDSGSYLLGATIALLVLVCWFQGTPLLIALAPLAIYLSDVGVTLVRRAFAGRPILQAHREHAYQVLIAYGWDHRKASLLVLTFSGVCCVLALMAQGGTISLALLGVLIPLVVLAYFVTIRKLSIN